MANTARQTIVRNLVLVALLVGGTLLSLFPHAAAFADAEVARTAAHVENRSGTLAGRARVQAQEHAGHLVFVGEAPSVPLASATIETKAIPRGEAVDAANLAQGVRLE